MTKSVQPKHTDILHPHARTSDQAPSHIQPVQTTASINPIMTGIVTGLLSGQAQRYMALGDAAKSHDNRQDDCYQSWKTHDARSGILAQSTHL